MDCRAIFRILTLFTLFLFTSGQLVAAENTGDSLLPDFYDDPSISTSAIKLTDYESSSVDYFSGMLARTATDYVLPGSGGMDLKVQRSYRSLQPYSWPERSAVGLGWSFHYGWLEIYDDNKLCDSLWSVSVMDNPVMHMPDGSVDVLALTEDGLSSMIDPTKIHYRGKSGIGLSCFLFEPNPGNRIELRTADGSRYLFERWSAGGAVTGFNKTAKYYVKEVIDRNGNWIRINNQNVGVDGTVISPVSILTSDGHDLSFEYENGLLVRVRHGLQAVVEYDYEPAIHPGTYHQLVAVDLGVDLNWSYQYSSYADDGSASLKVATNPFGGITSYDWQRIYFQSGDGQQLNAAVVRVEQQSTGEIPAVWQYAYFPASVAGERDKTMVFAPEGAYEYFHRSARNMTSGEVWMVGLKERVTFTPAFGQTREERYTWEPWFISRENNKRTTATGIYAAVDQSYYGARLTELRTTVGTNEWITTWSAWYTGELGVPEAQTVTMAGPAGEVRRLQRRFHHRPERHIYFLLAQQFYDQQLHPNRTPHSMIFDDRGNPISEYLNGFWSHKTWDEKGNLTSVIRGMNGTASEGEPRLTKFENYLWGIARRTVHPDDSISSAIIDERGRVLSRTNRDGQVVGYTYDGVGRVKSVDYPLGNDAYVTHLDRRTIVVRGAYRRTVTTDGFGRPVREKHEDMQSGGSVVVERRYDGLGRLIFLSYPNSVSGTTYVYDGYGRTLRVTHAGGERSYSYADGYRVDVRDERNNLTRIYRNEVGGHNSGEITRIESPHGVVTVIERNEYGLPLSVSQGSGSEFVTRRNHYSSGLVLLSSEDPETSSREFGYDLAGNLVAIGHIDNDSGGVRTQYNIYDLNDRVAATYSAVNDTLNINEDVARETVAAVLTYTYTAEGKPITQRRQEYVEQYGYSNQQLFAAIHDSTWTSQWDSNGNLSSEEANVGGRRWNVSYAYDGNDRLSEMTYPDGHVVGFSPNAFGWTTRAGAYAGNALHHPSSALAGFTYGNGKSFRMPIDEQYRISEIEVPGVIGLTYAYDGSGNTVSIADSIDPTTSVSIAYDGLNRMVAADGPWGNGSFAYDSVGNMSGKTIGESEISLEYDARNRLSASSGGVTKQYGYDHFGNLQRRGVERHVYDGLGKLLAVRTPDFSISTTYQYDARGRRIATSRFGEETFSLYSANDQLIYEEAPSRFERTKYIYLGGFLVAKKENYIGCEDDIDSDGIPHCVERDAGLNPFDPLDAFGDKDGDGLTNVYEYQLGTLIDNSDSDGDGIPDGLEVHYGLNPLLSDADADSDGDGMPNYYELIAGYDPSNPSDGMADDDNDGLSNAAEFAIGTSPVSEDTDSDGMPDGYEVAMGLNPRYNDAADDLDGDGLPNLVEFQVGLDPSDAGDALLDLDGDGLDNLDEYQRGTSIVNEDTDGDGVSDGEEIVLGTNPLLDDRQLDTDGDGMTNGCEALYGFDPNDPSDGSRDADLDGLSNALECSLGANPKSSDTDGDGMPDGYEVSFGLNPLVGDATFDHDHDGLPSGWEYQHGLDPRFPFDALMDHDGDGISTIDEYRNGTDPFVPAPIMPLGPVYVASGDMSVLVSWVDAPDQAVHDVLWGYLGDGVVNTVPNAGVAFKAALPGNGLYWFQVHARRGSEVRRGERVVVKAGVLEGYALPHTSPAGCSNTRTFAIGNGDFYLLCERGSDVQIMRFGSATQTAPVTFPAGAQQDGRVGWRFATTLTGEAAYLWLDAETDILYSVRYNAYSDAWEQPISLENETPYMVDGYNPHKVSAVTAFDVYGDWAGELHAYYAMSRSEYQSEKADVYRVALQSRNTAGAYSSQHMWRGGSRVAGIVIAAPDQALITSGSSGSRWLSRLAYDESVWAMVERTLNTVLPGRGIAVDRQIAAWIPWAATNDGVSVARFCGASCAPLLGNPESPPVSPTRVFAFGGAGLGQAYWYSPGAIRYSQVAADRKGVLGWSAPATLVADAGLQNPDRLHLASGEKAAHFLWSNTEEQVRISSVNNLGGWSTPVTLPVSGALVDAAADWAGGMVVTVEQAGSYVFREYRPVSSQVDYRNDTTPPVVSFETLRSGSKTIKHVVSLNADEPANVFFRVTGGTVSGGGVNTSEEQRYTGPVTITFAKGASATLTWRGINMAEHWSAPVTQVLQ